MIADVLKDAASRKTSILLLGAPGMGKTSVIREMASVLSEEELSVMIVDTSNEIAGDGDVPHPAIGSARRMQVLDARQQHKCMIEAVQNHTPDIVIVDEVRTCCKHAYQRHTNPSCGAAALQSRLEREVKPQLAARSPVVA
jgi:stage III sporulation protein SpoIIIAA